MSWYTRTFLFVFALLCALSPSFASSPAIGLVVVNGSFQLDHSQVWGNATLFDGNLIETGISASRLQLRDGVNMRLAADSRARVFQSRLVLEKGIAQLESPNYRIEAATLQVSSDAPGAIARVQMDGISRVIVAVREGHAQVTNRDGILVAKLDSGNAMSFQPQAEGAIAPTQVSGCLVAKDGKFLLVDRTTKVTLELQGAGLQAEAGNQVEITGTAATTQPTVTGASQVVHVNAVKHVSTGGCSGAAKKVAAAGGAAGGAAAAGASAGATAGLSTGATVAIVGGVAAAGTVAGLAAEGDLPGQGGQKPNTSR